MRKTRELSFLLMLVLLLVSAPHAVLPTFALTEGDYEYTLINDGTEVEITKYVGPGGEVYIPNKIDGKYVTSIGTSAFEGNTEITYVWMSDHVISIGSNAFKGCASIEKIDFGAGLLAIYKQAFYGCVSLVQVVIPHSVTYIADSDNYSDSVGVFEACSSLEKVTIGNGLERIPKDAFRDCDSLKEVVLGENVKSVGKEAFAYNIALEKICFNQQLNEVGNGAFYGCTSLENVVLPKSVTTIGADAFFNCSALEIIDFGEGVQRIYERAFSNCTSLKQVNLPDSLIYIEGSGNYSDSTGVFENCTALETVVIGDGLKNISRETFRNCTALKEITFGENMEVIGARAFENNIKLESISFPDSMTTIEMSAFYNCNSLEKVDLGVGLKSIYQQAFYRCSSLKHIVLPDSLTYIEGSDNYSSSVGVFEDCFSLEIVVVGDNLKTLPKEVFRNCTALKEIIFGENVKVIGARAFENNSNLEKISLPDSLTTIENGAFSKCSSLKDIDFGAGLKEIYEHAFRYCSSLKKLVLPDSLTYLEKAKNLTDHVGVFGNCDSLELVILGAGVSSIPKYTFYGCSSLKNVVIGPNVEVIDNAFAKNNSLKNTFFLGDVSSINDSFIDNTAWYCLPDLQEQYPSSTVSTTYFEVTINANGGVTQLSEDVSEEVYTKYAELGILTEPLIPVREGYTFEGWYLNEECTGEPFDFLNDRITQTTTLYAKWTVNTYRVFFDPRGGDVEIGGIYVQYGQSLGELPIPTLENDTFDGWYLGMNSSGPQYTATTKMPAKDIVLYAGWENNDSALTVIFDTNGGNFLLPVNVSSGDTVAKPQDPVREGYTFIGWYKESSLENKFGFESDKITSNTTIYALWENNTPKICIHEYDDGIVSIQPTCESAGEKKVTCSLCGDFFIEPIATLGHQYVSGFCTVCGHQNFQYGDANDDGRINSSDITRLLRYLANRDPMTGESSVVIGYGADCNGDGKISSTDVTRLLRYLANRDPMTGESSIVLGPAN